MQSLIILIILNIHNILNIHKSLQNNKVKKYNYLKIIILFKLSIINLKNGVCKDSYNKQVN